MITMSEWEDFKKYYLKHYQSQRSITQVKRFIISVVLMAVGIILMASLVAYSLWNIITVILISLIGYHTTTIFIDWKVKNNKKDREKVYESVPE